MKTNHSAALGLAYVALLAHTGCERASVSAPEPKKPKLVFITSGEASFWELAVPGIEAAAKDFRAEFELLPAPIDADGIAYSPTNGAVQLAAAGSGCLLGMDHYKAGRKAGSLIKEALPRGGKILIFHEIDELQAQERQHGILDELADQPPGKFVFVEEQGELVVAHDLTRCLDALCAADQLGQVKVIGFGENERALEALAARHVYALVTHQPYQYGYHAVRVLAGLARGDVSVLPRGGFLEIPPVVRRVETTSHTAARRVH